MPSALRIDRAGAELIYAWIEAQVVRIGSDPRSEIHIDGIDPQAATLLYQEGRFYVINRARRTMVLAGEQLSPGVTAMWKSGSELVINETIKLRLLCHADPRPQPAALGRWLPEPDRPEREFEAQREFRRQIMCFVLTAAALFVTAALYATRHRASLPDRWFATVLAAVQSEEERDTPAAAEIRELLQAAYGLEKRTSTKEACRFYCLARERLAQVPASTGPAACWVLKARTFVLSRLQVL